MTRYGLLLALCTSMPACSVDSAGLGSDEPFGPIDSSVGLDSGSFDASSSEDTGTTAVDSADDTAIDSGSVPDTAETDTFEAAVDSADDTAPTMDTAVTDTSPTCTDPGSVPYAGHCYFPIAGGSWAASRDACAAAGAHLAAVTTATEQAVVASFAVATDRWIGLTQSTTAFSWVTGETIGYANWDTGEPNGSGPCGRMVLGGKWRDWPCDSALGAVCERD